MLRPALGNIALGTKNALTRKKRLLLEVASMDGAVLFDNHNLLAFGAMLNSHSQVGSHAGARTTAALSAFHAGGHPIKVSSDGDITVYFTSKGPGDETCSAQLSFL